MCTRYRSLSSARQLPIVWHEMRLTLRAATSAFQPCTRFDQWHVANPLGEPPWIHLGCVAAIQAQRPQRAPRDNSLPDGCDARDANH
jgi:hypothetical protein